MITVNLLPYELRPIKRTPLPYILCTLLLFGALFACFKININDNQAREESETTLRKNQEELASLQPSIDKHNKLAEESEILVMRLRTIKEIASNRIIWSQQLYNLTRLSADKNMWFDSISVKQRPYTATESVYDPETKKSTEKTIRKYQPILTLKGYVASGTDGRATISLFMDATDNDAEFSAKFTPESPAFADTEFEGTPVREFTLQYVVSQGVEK